MNRMVRALPLLSALGLLACGEPRVSLARGPRRYGPDSYDTVLKRWTRSGRTLDHLDTPLAVTATFFSWDFAWAYAVKKAKILRLGKREALRLRKEILARSQQTLEFYVAAATQDLVANDLARKDSLWRVTLWTDAGLRVPASDIEQVRRKEGFPTRLFPYTGPFHEGYWVRFPRTWRGKPVLPGNTKWFALSFAGPKGYVRLVWKVRSR